MEKVSPYVESESLLKYTNSDELLGKVNDRSSFVTLSLQQFGSTIYKIIRLLKQALRSLGITLLSFWHTEVYSRTRVKRE